VEPKKSTELSLNGLDEIQFLVNTNPGQSLRALNKVASGGELSRLSLAIQMATSNNLKIPTLIFDEVDTGVGGATAEIVGKHLRKLGNSAQVFCVTHLPQVAAQSHHHYKVNKFEKNESIATKIAHLAEDDRIEELARMLGGIELTKNTQEHAKEMLRQSKL
jgi:DNA repair protein RecN (Recombination protein N)